MTAAAPLGEFVARAQAGGALVVQPRMGFSDPATMRAGLAATKAAAATTVGTITLDSYTRVGDDEAVARALRERTPLNGYPIVALPRSTSQAVLDGLRDATFPVQVRHGSATPDRIFAALIELGLDATEGGPVSYCLPYSRTPLREAVASWRRSCRLLAATAGRGAAPHLESFGGCMLGQLCPPGLLVAITLLEALFFVQHGLRSISLSYAQQQNPEQDRQALAALRRLAGELLPGVEWHIVLYAYMGVYPRTQGGAMRLLGAAAELAVGAGAARLIVKTAAEAHRIPTIADNVEALELAAGRAARAARRDDRGPGDEPDDEVYLEARALVEAVAGLDPDVGRALLTAFGRGLLDVPFCLHPDNAGRTRSYVDDRGWLRWSDTGAMPIPAARPGRPTGRLTAAGLLAALSGVQRRYDEGAR
ncbi:methylaspartate mutase [Amorphoplanes nipponensis]|uniref:Methylaspartate mutase n=1 Tax=Actinoplanes nipponensis TaxID=135950 RepID=A0A919JS28_9ACTN|nr:methylaspartate mutase [Actinoplanes nipponensis]GIE54415.1 methylaspartate mutase [Actinoplanes nipponensis]